MYIFNIGYDNIFIGGVHMTIGQNIKLYRKEKGLTQKKLGELIDKKEITIRKYESGDITPSIQTLDKISEALEISSFLLVSGTGSSVSFNKNGAIKKLKIYPEDVTLKHKELLDEYIENMKDSVNYFIGEVSGKYDISVSYTENEIFILNEYLINQTLLKLIELKSSNITLKAENKDINE